MRYVFIAFFLVLLITAIYFNTTDSTRDVLEIREVSTQEIIEEFPISEGDTIGIKFIHSYDLGTVLENFRVIEGGEFLLYQAIFTEQSYDGRELTFPNATRITQNGTIYLNDIDEHYNVTFNELNVRVPYVTSQWIIVGEKDVTLSSLASKGTLLQIVVNSK